jgi:hypothetical protein
MLGDLGLVPVFLSGRRFSRPGALNVVGGNGRAFGALAAAVLVLGLVVGAHAQDFGIPVDRLFRLEWEVPEYSPRGPVVTGYVYNLTSNRAGSVELQVDVLDGSGQVVGRGTGWVYGDVPPSGRGYFVVSIPRRGSAYRVAIASFSWQTTGR